MTEELVLTPEEQAHMDSGGAKSLEDAVTPEAKEEVEESDPSLSIETDEPSEPVKVEVEPEAKPEKPKDRARKRIQEQNDKIIEQGNEIQQIKGRFEQMMQTLQKPAPQEIPMPDPLEDPDGYREAKDQKIDAELSELRDFKKNYEDQQEQSQNWKQINAQITQSVNTFKSDHSDFDKVMGEWNQERIRELREDFGVTDPQAASQAAWNDLQTVALKAMNDKEDPAERIYKYVSRKIGRKVEETVFEPEEEFADEEEKVNDTVETLKKAQNAASKMKGGGSTPTTLTAQSIIDMSPTEFKKFMSDPEKAMDMVKRLPTQ